MMSCSCCSTTNKKGRKVCPTCKQSCFPVGRQTMLHQVQFPDNQNMVSGDYAFCSNQDCTTGYFSAVTIISKSKLREFQSEKYTMLCHCFAISKPVYQTALNNGTAKAIKDFVVKQTKESLCACESRNPSGRCCLVNFTRMEKEHAN
ncbi:putative iron-sulfur cluster-binding metallochaperone [Ghiorsea bivora]|uniref:putative iron-sulfur cluster-binding metallochaperone n=1 Tax=Ghiorsea bivora TaxID=1485545 RepID=UPI002962563B|nr:hypothetical protein [Ghiorsea bivora]